MSRRQTVGARAPIIGRTLLWVALWWVAPLSAQQGTPLDHYVRSPDPHYDWEVVGTAEGDGYRTLVVRMTSQAWLTEEHVDRPVWWHWLTIVVPDEVESDVAFLYIGGGDNDDEQPEDASPLMRLVATASNAVVAELGMVPNQPLAFAGDDHGPRVEDELIAYGWNRFLRGGARDHDALWLARLPMTKAAVRAMDTVSAATAAEDVTVAEFVVAGGSKRGWTTWTTAAVDDRVVAIAPAVIDLLNVVPSFEHHWRAYGFWAPAVGDYDREGIMDWQGRDEYERLLEITEPYSYRQRLDLPKLLINATGDQFFLPDSWQFYWNDLEGEKHLRYVPNADHSLGDTDVLTTLTAFFRSVVQERGRPSYVWTVAANRIEVTADVSDPPREVTLWQARNESTRDFRVARIRRTWTSTPLEAASPGRWVVELEEPAAGWTASFVELTFGQGFDELKVTSGVKVLPEELPHPPYEPDTTVLP